jgi:hypothetical protein
MAYTKTSLIARPGNQDLGVDWGAAGSSVLNFFGSGLKAQGAQEALAAQLAAQNAAKQGSDMTVPLVIGGVVLVGVLVMVMRKKKSA